MKHALPVNKSCHGYFASVGDFVSTSSPENLHRSQTKAVLTHVTELLQQFLLHESNGDVIQQRLDKQAIAILLNNHSLALWKSSLEDLNFVDNSVKSDVYFIFTFEIRQNIFLGM